MIVGGQHYARTGVGTTSDPGTVYSKQHQDHQQGYDHNCLDVHSHGVLVFGFLLFCFLGFANLSSDKKDIRKACQMWHTLACIFLQKRPVRYKQIMVQVNKLRLYWLYFNKLLIVSLRKFQRTCHHMDEFLPRPLTLSYNLSFLLSAGSSLVSLPEDFGASSLR